MVDNNIKWTLIVNGDKKPWHTDNYLDEPISINLNYGLDSSIYESKPLKFRVVDVINGEIVEGVTVDEQNHLIICDIPIVERTKTIKLLFDWSYIRNIIKKDLEVYAGTNKIHVGEDMKIQLKGKDISAPLVFRYKGEKCVSTNEDLDDMNIIHIILPEVKNQNVTAINEENKSKRIFVVSSLVCLFSVILTLIFIKDHTNKIEELAQSNKNLQTEIESLEKILPSLLVNATVWDKDAFETAGYRELYDALKDMDLGKVEEYSEKIKPQSGSQWNGIITKCKELKDKGIKASRSYSVSQGIDIERWKSYINKHNISNLVNNQKWYRKDFADADYAGLYDALNTFNFAEVIEYSNNLGIKNLKQDDPWNDIVFICKKYKDKRVLLDSYSNDGSITITKWIEFVKQKLNTKSAKPSQEEGNKDSDKMRNGRYEI